MDEITAQQEIAFIKKIMQDSRRIVYSDGMEFIYWGSIVVICLLFTYFSVYWNTERYIFYFWTAFLLLGFLGNTFFLQKRYKKLKVKSFAGNILSVIWVAAGTAMLIVGFVGPLSNAYDGVFISPLISTILGTAYLLTGYIYGKKWVSYLSAFWWAGAIVMFIWPGLYTILLMAGMMILLQIIPGIILYKDSEREFAQTEQ
jgi:4-hydroxybenzoate polyprenyltransferase